MITQNLEADESAPAERDVQEQYFAILAKILSFLMLGFGLASIALAIRLVVTATSPVLFGDQWGLIHVLATEKHPFRLNSLWSQHNEHRLLAGRLLGFADLFLFGHQNISLFIEILVIQAGEAAVLAWVARQFAGLRGSAFVSVLGFILFCCFSFTQFENFIWGFQTVFVLAQFAASCCFAAAVWHAALPQTDVRKQIAYAVCLLSAFAAESSLASGVLTWPLLFVLAWKLQFPRRKLAIIGLVGTFAILMYLIGYQLPADPVGSRPLDYLKHPVSVLRFIGIYFASCWNAYLPTTSPWPSISESVSLLAFFAVIIVGLYILIRGKRLAFINGFLLANLCFGVGSATITALGRLKFSLAQAISSRYHTIALIFWACCGIAAVRYVVNRKIRGGLLPLQLLALLLFVDSLGRWQLIAESTKQRKAASLQGWAALVHHSLKDPIVAQGLFPAPSFLPHCYQYLREHHLEPTTDIPAEAVVEPDKASARLDQYRVVSNSAAGSIDAVQSFSYNARIVHGKVFMPKNARKIEVVLADSQGKTVGIARVDAQNNATTATEFDKQSEVSWTSKLIISGPGIYHAFLVDRDTGTAYPLKNELNLD